MVRNINNLTNELFDIFNNYKHQEFDVMKSISILILIVYSRKISVSKRHSIIYSYLNYYLPLNTIFFDSVMRCFISGNCNTESYTPLSNISDSILKEHEYSFRHI